MKVDAPTNSRTEEEKVELMKKKMKERGEKAEERREQRMTKGRRGRRGSDSDGEVRMERSRNGNLECQKSDVQKTFN